MTKTGFRLNDSEILTRLVDETILGEPHAYKGLQVFPLLTGNGHEAAYDLIDDLLEQGKAEITELHEHGAVPVIKVRNRADVDALILDGMELHGAKQNRMVNVTIIVGKQSETEIPVSCVEQGRWSYRSRSFATTKRTVAAKLRRDKAAMVAEQFARGRRAETDQGAVWRHVERYVRDSGARSDSMALGAAFTDREAAIDEYVDALQGIEATGVVVAINGEIVSLDLFDSKEALRRLWPMLLRGHAFDAVLEPDGSATVTYSEVETWIRQATAAAIRREPLPGVGEHLSVRGNQLVGGITIHEERVVHVALYPTKEMGSWDEA